MRRLLENTQSACVITHRHADLDAYACGVAAKELMEYFGIKSRLVVPEDISIEVKNYISKVNIKPIHTNSCDISDLVILVDVSTLSQINELAQFISGKRILVIDHHVIHNINPTLSIVDSNATSCSEIVAMMFKELNIKPSKDASLLLLGGIISDSNRFTRARIETFEIMQWLLNNIDIKYSDVLNALSIEMSFSERMARIKGMLRLRAYRLGDIIACLSKVDAYESSLADLLIRTGCDIALIASEHDDEVRLIGRSTGKVSISLAVIFNEVAKYFGGEGGGHNAAAALSIMTKVDPWTVLTKTLTVIESKLGIKAQKILTS